MIGLLTGAVLTKYPTQLLLNVGGVGYVVHAGQRLLARLTLKQNCTLFIHTYVREDALDLYGFLNQDELLLFELLLTVSGIGPRTSVAIVDRGVTAVHQAVLESDVDFFTTIPRLGKKNAQKIIIELKTKLGSIKELDLSQEASGETKQLLDALLSMGFARSEALGAIKKLPPEAVTLGGKIRHALQNLGRP